MTKEDVSMWLDDRISETDEVLFDSESVERGQMLRNQLTIMATLQFLLDSSPGE